MDWTRKVGKHLKKMQKHWSNFQINMMEHDSSFLFHRICNPYSPPEEVNLKLLFRLYPEGAHRATQTKVAGAVGSLAGFFTLCVLFSVFPAHHRLAAQGLFNWPLLDSSVFMCDASALRLLPAVFSDPKRGFSILVLLSWPRI